MRCRNGGTQNWICRVASATSNATNQKKATRERCFLLACKIQLLPSQLNFTIVSRSGGTLNLKLRQSVFLSKDLYAQFMPHFVRREFIVLSNTNKNKRMTDWSSFCFWSKWRDSNSRPPVPETGALPPALHLEIILKDYNIF